MFTEKPPSDPEEEGKDTEKVQKVKSQQPTPAQKKDQTKMVYKAKSTKEASASLDL